MGARQHHLVQLQDRGNGSHRHGLQTREAAASRVTATHPGKRIGVNPMAKKILLADDSITIQKVVELTFSDGDYEVTAVNNGAKAIQKLADMRPDIILSDIIMPEKNGYEVCEYVKSHPELRNLPVVLLTGTFEPFDPDRAEKAGCDAVVTKPFESQSLIHKVEELISASKAAAAQAVSEAPTATIPLSTTESPWEEPAAETHEEPFAAPGPFAHGGDIFGAPQAPPLPTTEMPFESSAPAFGGETRAFPQLNFAELQRIQQEPAAAAPPPTTPPIEPSPWDEGPAFGGETRAFPRMSFDELQKQMGQPPPAPDPPAAPATAAEPSPWDEGPAFGGETRAFPRMSFDELQKQMEQAAPVPPEPPPAPAPAPEPSPWDEGEGFGGETRAFPRMSFDDLQKVEAAPEPVAPVAEPEPEPAPWEEPAPIQAETPVAASELSIWEEQPAASDNDVAAFAESPFAAPEPEPEPEPEPLPELAPAVEPDTAAPASVNPQITDVVTQSAAPSSFDLTDEQIDRIAKRVVQMMSEQVVRNIAWEVIPDMAEMVVKERIKQLEAE